MEINRTSIDVDAAALQGLETRLVYASFVQYCNLTAASCCSQVIIKISIPAGIP